MRLCGAVVDDVRPTYCVRPRHHPDPDLHMADPVLDPWCHGWVVPGGSGDELPAWSQPDDPSSALMHQGCVVEMHSEHAALPQGGA